MFQHAAPERIRISGIEAALIRRGSGRPLLYLHAGDGVDPQDRFLELLGEHFTVLAPSHPGFGDSPLPAHFSEVGDLAYFYLDLLRQLDLRDCLVVGSSFGGWIASEMAIRCTERIAGLVLAAPMGLYLGGDAPCSLDLLSLAVAELPATLFADAQLGREAFDELRFGELPEEAVTRFVRNREALTLYGWSPTLASPTLTRWLHRIRVPTLLLWGAQDRVVPPAQIDTYARVIPGAHRQLVAQAGHYLHIEQPRAFADAIARFADTQVHRAAETA
jgi:pimeloyl-ACP methyl ester carboxylesterase